MGEPWEKYQVTPAAPAATPAAPAGPWSKYGGEAAAAKPRTAWDSLSDFGGSFWEGVGGKALSDIVMGASRNPEAGKKAVDTAKALVQGMANEPARIWGQLSETGKSMLHGDVAGAAYHAAGSVPLVGAPAQQVAHDFDNGDYAKGFGHALGLLLPFAAGALPKDVPVTPAMKNPNPVSAAAVRFADQHDIPVSLATRTGSQAARAVEGFVQNDIGGGFAGKARQATTEGLRRVGEDLADQTLPVPVSAEDAGAGVISDLQQSITDLHKQSSAAYKDFHKVEQYPQNVRRTQTGMQNGQPVFENMALPVDMRPIKAALQPIYVGYTRTMPVANQRASVGLKALENIMNEGDFKPASIAEMDLGAIKEAARSEMPELRDVSSGLAARATMDLDGAIRGAVQNAYVPGYRNGAAPGTTNPALQALLDGRKLTAEKWDVADTLKSFGRKIEDLEPVQVFKGLTWEKDSGIQRLREVQKRAPNAMPGIGRAYLEGLLDAATREGDFQKAQGILSKWDTLGPETKKVLFRDPTLVKDLDNFFVLAKRATENPNPSGTARVVSAMTHVGTIVPGLGMLVSSPTAGAAILGAEGLRLVSNAGLARILFSPGGSRALANGLRVPLRTPMGAATAAQILKLAGDDAKPFDQSQQQ